ncbi:TRM11 family SAM-dependent methyltransferase [Kribbella hippodromi]|uniref:TRM11 family SAM-dependent methyltransferase n=1 Tax=Kribbella hippodromi TaxID=434347 RepID=UPI0031E18C80
MAGFFGPGCGGLSRVAGRFVLRTVDGAADLLIEELRGMVAVHSVRQVSVGAVECMVDGALDELVRCPLYSSVAVDGAEVPALAWMRRFGPLERLPWSTNLVVAEVLTRLAKVRPGQCVVDPFCGTGTILLSVRRRVPTARLLGIDRDPHALELAARNLSHPALVRGLAEALPVSDGSVDRVVANLPFGKQVGSHRGNRELYPAVVRELDRVLAGEGRAVLLTEDKRLLRAAVERERGLKVVRERLLRYNGATPTAYVLTRISKRPTSR